MRGAAFLLPMILLTACGDRRDFSQRYNDTGAAMAAQARALDANLQTDNLPEPENNEERRPGE